jgi:antitoxin (DNA-binding transcriptional repressor) of toxin-antitoxin stability system
MKTVSARDANQGFSKLLNEVAAGEEIVITRRGEPVARLSKFDGPVMTPERKAAIKELMDHLRQNARPLNIGKWTREELYDRDLDRE